MSHNVYINQILESVVKSWLEQERGFQGKNFVLEEDGDNEHGGTRNVKKENSVQKWKRENSL